MKHIMKEPMGGKVSNRLVVLSLLLCTITGLNSAEYNNRNMISPNDVVARIIQECQIKTMEFSSLSLQQITKEKIDDYVTYARNKKLEIEDIDSKLSLQQIDRLKVAIFDLYGNISIYCDKIKGSSLCSFENFMSEINNVKSKLLSVRKKHLMDTPQFTITETKSPLDSDAKAGTFALIK